MTHRRALVAIRGKHSVLFPCLPSQLASVDLLKSHFLVLVLTTLLANGLMYGQRQRWGKWERGA